MKSWKNRLVSALMISTIILQSAAPVAVLANETNGGIDIEQVLATNSTLGNVVDEKNGITYHNAGSNDFTNKPNEFIETLLTNKSIPTPIKDSNRLDSVNDLWMGLGVMMQADQLRQSDDGYLKDLLSFIGHNYVYQHGDFTESYEGKYPVKFFDGSEGEAEIAQTGLRSAASIDEALDDIEDYLVFSNSSSISRKGEIERYDDRKQPVFYSSFRNEANDQISVIYHDFKASPLVGDQTVQAQGDVKIEGGTPKETGYATGIQNRTTQDVTTEQSLAKTTSESLTNSMHGSTSFGFEETLSVGVQVNYLKLLSVSTNLSFTSSQTFENGWQEDTTNSKDETYTSTTNITIPAHTQVLLSQNESESTHSVEYNVPVALSYSVTIVSHKIRRGRMWPVGDFELHGDKVATFEGNAINDFRNRAIHNFNYADKEKLNWQEISNAIENNMHEGEIIKDKDFKSKVIFKDYADSLTSNIPMSPTGGSMSYNLKTINNDISSLVPIYPLSKINTQHNLYEYQLTSGESIYTDAIPLEGKNAHKGDYYGFDAENGSWILVDKEGNPVDEEDGDVAKLVVDSVTKHTELVAGRQEGTVYLKYLIDEDAYVKDYTNATSNDYIQNTDLAETAQIKVKVSPVPFSGTIHIEGDVQGIVGDAPIDLNSVLKTSVQDDSGKEHIRQVRWDRRQTKGVKIDNDHLISFTEPGTYEIRAEVDGVKSDWFQVTATEARALNSISVADTNELLEGIDVADGQPVSIPLASFSVAAYDQYEAPFQTDVEWQVAGEEATIENGNLVISAPGEFELWAETNGVQSNVLSFIAKETARPDSIKVTDPKTSLIEGQSLDLNLLAPTMLDQYGEAFAGIDPAEITFTLAEDSHPASITDAELTTEEGVLKDGTTGNILVKAVHVATGIESAPITISVAQQAAAKTVTAKVKKQHGQYIEKGKAIAINDILASTVKDQYGKAFAGEVEWVSSDPSKVKIQNSKVTGLVANAKVNVTAKVGNAKSAPIALTVRTLQGDAVKNGKYATIQTKGYAVTSDFKGTKKTTSDKLLHKTYQVRHHYNHVDGQRYYSLHDSKGTFIGYVNAKAAKLSVGVEGAKYADSGYVSISKNGYYVLSHLIGKNKMTTNSVLWNTYKVTARYQHFDGDTYYAIADGKNKHVGYVNAKAVSKGKVAEGVKHNKKQYITFTKNYGLMKKFGSASTSNTKNMINKSYKVKSLHKHVNGESYYGVYDWADNFKGYVNAKSGKITTGAQGVAHKEKRYVTITNKCYNTWSSFSWKKRKSAGSIYGKTYQVKVKYNHANGETYYSLYDKKGNWHGYINAKAAKTGKGAQGVYQKHGKKVKITKTCCNVYSNFNWRKKTDIKKLKGQVFTAKGKYVHLNGNTYYSLYNAKGKWMGYVNAHTVSNVK